MSALAAAFGLMLFLWLVNRGNGYTRDRSCYKCGERIVWDASPNATTHWVHAKTNYCWDPPYTSREWSTRYLAGESDLIQPHVALPNDTDF